MKIFILTLFSFFVLAEDSSGVKCVEPVNPVLDDEVVENFTAIRPTLDRDSVDLLCRSIPSCAGTVEVKKVLDVFYNTNNINEDEFVKHYLYDLKCQYKIGCPTCKKSMMEYFIDSNPSMFGCLVYSSSDLKNHKEHLFEVEREYGGKTQTLFDYVKSLRDDFLNNGKRESFRRLIKLFNITNNS